MLPTMASADLSATLFIRSAYTAPISSTAFATMSATTAAAFCGRVVDVGNPAADAFVRLLEAFAAREIAEDIPTAETTWAERLSISAAYTKMGAVQIQRWWLCKLSFVDDARQIGGRS